MLSFLVTDVIISKRGGMLQYAIAYSISRRLFRSLFPMRTFFVHIQLAVDHAIKKKKLLFIVHCNFVVKTVRTLNKLRSLKVVLSGYFFMLKAEST